MSGRQVARNGPEKVVRSQQGILDQVKDIYLVSIGKLLSSGNNIISCASYSVLWVIFSERKAQRGPKVQSERPPRTCGHLGECCNGGAMEL